jgi:hypothetical protein
MTKSQGSDIISYSIDFPYGPKKVVSHLSTNDLANGAHMILAADDRSEILVMHKVKKWFLAVAH